MSARTVERTAGEHSSHSTLYKWSVFALTFGLMLSDYLTRNVVFDLGEREHQGLQLYLKHALALDRVTVPAGA